MVKVGWKVILVTRKKNASIGFSSGTEATTSGYMDYLTFAGVSGIGTITMTFTEPLVIGQPLGTLSLGVLLNNAVT